MAGMEGFSIGGTMVLAWRSGRHCGCHCQVGRRTTAASGQEGLLPVEGCHLKLSPGL